MSHAVCVHITVGEMLWITGVGFAMPLVCNPSPLKLCFWGSQYCCKQCVIAQFRALLLKGEESNKSIVAFAYSLGELIGY